MGITIAVHSSKGGSGKTSFAINLAFAYVSEGKSVCLVIAPRDFRDEELIETRKELESAGAKVTLVSTHTKPVKGMLGAVARPDGLITQVDPARYDAVVFIGGSGTTALFDAGGSALPACNVLGARR